MVNISKDNEFVKVKSTYLRCDDLQESLVVDRYIWKDEPYNDGIYVEFSIYDNYLLNKNSLLQRIKYAIKFIFKKPSSYTEVCIYDKKEFLNFIEDLKEIAK